MEAPVSKPVEKLDHPNHALLKAGSIVAHEKRLLDTLPADLERFLGIDLVEEATGMPRKLVYKWMARNLFPKQVLIKAVPNAKKYKAVWLASEIVQWQRDRIAENRAVAMGEAAPLPSRLQPPARERARITAQKNIADRKSAAAPTQGTRHRSRKGTHQHARDDEAAPA
jgi:predicted DNA-binding transcriptional regulator AlpA